MLAGFGPVQVSRCGITRKRKANPMRGQESDGSGGSDDVLGNQGGAKLQPVTSYTQSARVRPGELPNLPR